jgi:hypothetical protein
MFLAKCQCPNITPCDPIVSAQCRQSASLGRVVFSMVVGRLLMSQKCTVLKCRDGDVDPFTVLIQDGLSQMCIVVIDSCLAPP